VTVSVFTARYRVYEDVVASTHTVPLNEAINWLPSDAVVVTEPATELLVPEPHGGGGLAAICEPLVVPRWTGVPNVVPTEVVTSFVVDVIVPLPNATQGTPFPAVGVADAAPSKKERPKTATRARMQALLIATRFPANGQNRCVPLRPNALHLCALHDADVCLLAAPSDDANTALRFSWQEQPTVPLIQARTGTPSPIADPRVKLSDHR
jgi:hypothetical protein